ncbi:hypothetical protein [Microbulbifer sp. VAAF005]|uniref:hypothetical protein n=1 Tax=Microbulbifer sp. VAAF005 TaxID=3034230 RepID=UPI0024AD6CCC|nr:hypothetical protein [Microbulbifer sp. VAAF005]WHI45430.1 hypothetical protein P0078_17090 [Microbulbifer sp. VAAF005]
MGALLERGYTQASIIGVVTDSQNPEVSVHLRKSADWRALISQDNETVPGQV